MSLILKLHVLGAHWPKTSRSIGKSGYKYLIGKTSKNIYSYLIVIALVTKVPVEPQTQYS